ncbi:MAG: hypothetical protein P9L98_03835 [Candidatus Kaelpia imicola]|nr:hypothetical protein [Candidatus Kaelpia imicola]
MKLTVLISNNISKKRKNIILTAVFLSLVLFSSNSYSQTLSNWEFNVYYDFIDKFFDMDSWTKESEDRISREVATKYNISYKQVRDIVDRAFERGVSDWEWDVGEEIYTRLSSLPESLQTDNESDKIFREFENKYNISRNYINDILYRTIWELMWGYDY